MSPRSTKSIEISLEHKARNIHWRDRSIPCSTADSLVLLLSSEPPTRFAEAGIPPSVHTHTDCLMLWPHRRKSFACHLLQQFSPPRDVGMSFILRRSTRRCHLRCSRRLRNCVNDRWESSLTGPFLHSRYIYSRKSQPHIMVRWPSGLRRYV